MLAWAPWITKEPMEPRGEGANDSQLAMTTTILFLFENERDSHDEYLNHDEILIS